MFEPKASLCVTPLEASTAGRLLGSDTDFAAMQSIAPAGRAEGAGNLCSDPENARSRIFSTVRPEVSKDQAEPVHALFFFD